jgi:hypothetical protein
LALEGISGTHAVDSAAGKEDILITNTTTVGLVEGTLAIAEQIHYFLRL